MMRLTTVLLILFLFAGSTGIAQDSERPDPRQYVFTDVAQVDEDFQYQGEYGGSVYLPGRGCGWVGLQVIARGGGQFEAVLLPGGLPGNGWDRQTRISLSGSLVEGTLTLNGGGLTIACDGYRGTVTDENGSDLGLLQKIRRTSRTMGAAPTPGAIVLFDGSSTENLTNARVTEDGLLDVGFSTAKPVKDFRLHLEFRTPYMPYATGQGRGNSGCYIQRRYEVQILDSFGLEGVNNECGGLYKQQRPDVNMAFPPLTWQTYDIWFTAARWDDAGNKIANARITVLHNGVAIHNNREIKAKTGAGRPEGPEPMEILFQNHGNPVRFRNIWIVMQDQQPAQATTSVTCTSKRRFKFHLLPRRRRR